MKTLTLYEIATALGDIETAEGCIQISEDLRTQIAYGLGHAARQVNKLEKINAELLAKIDRVMAPE